MGFADEIGNIAKALSIDSHLVMDIICQDTQLSLSPYYLKLGFAFGGLFLPKDVRALIYAARSMNLDVPILDSVPESNRKEIERDLDRIIATDRKKIGVLGFCFKAGTDNLRESPIVSVIEALIGKGFDLRLFDQNVKLASLVGANPEFIEKHIPYISRLIVDTIDEVLDHAGVVVVGNNAPEFRELLARLNDGQKLIDLVRISEGESIEGRYNGICW